MRCKIFPTAPCTSLRGNLVGFSRLPGQVYRSRQQSFNLHRALLVRHNGFGNEAASVKLGGSGSFLLSTKPFGPRPRLSANLALPARRSASSGDRSKQSGSRNSSLKDIQIYAASLRLCPRQRRARSVLAASLVPSSRVNGRVGILDACSDIRCRPAPFARAG